MSDVAEMRARFEAAREEVDDLCHGKHGWRMCIPVQQTDSDIVISSALNDIDTLLTALAQAEAELEARTAEKHAAVEWLKTLTCAASDEDFDSGNWATDWRERWRARND